MLVGGLCTAASRQAFTFHFQADVQGCEEYFSFFSYSTDISQAHSVETISLCLQVDYGKKSEEEMNLYTLGLDSSDITQALIADKLASDVRCLD